METYSLDLSFMDDYKSQLPHAPIAEIYVKSCGHRTEDGPPIITPECVTISELEDQVDRLIGELEGIRKKARAKFAAEARRPRNSR
jgi:hypothetical protein